MSNIPYIKLNDKSIVLQLSTGPLTITPYTFNYHKIRKLLPTSEAILLPLLKTPALPNGLFCLYNITNTLVLTITSANETKTYTLKDASWDPFNGSKYDDLCSNTTLVGVFTGFDDIANQLPEHFI